MIPAPVPLIIAPTPLHRLDRASERLGIELWIKRDDLTGFAFGGNKGRKLEYLMADALAQNAEVVVTCGSAQSNFVRQLGAACSRFGIRCVAVAMALPFEDSRPIEAGLRPDGGNVFLDRVLGVQLQLHPDGAWEQLYALAEAEASKLEASGARVYRVPIGGSSPLGAYSFAMATAEIGAQSDAFDWIVAATSSGSTQTGLTWALKGGSTQVLGVACDPEPEIVGDFVSLAAELDRLTGEIRELKAGDFLIDFDFVGPGYGVPSAAGNEAIEFLAQCEGIFLDPIYSGKAFACLMSRARAGALPGRVLFWHTGGVPALFAMEGTG